MWSIRIARRYCIGFAVLCGLSGGCTKTPALPPMNPAEYKGALETLAQTKVYFGHQSVGRNVVQGLEELSKSAQVPLRIHKMDGPASSTPGLEHGEIGKNGDPLGKIADFSQVLSRPDMAGTQVAVLKFCYLDIAQDAVKDPRALVEAYARAAEAIKAAHPNVRLVHSTAPLRSDPPGWKTAIKRMIGRETWEDADNVLRGAYNDELRRRFAGQPLFDIALAESTLPDGSRSAFVKDGKSVPTLAAVYTNDGGHLNEYGRMYIAGVFAKAVADAARSPGTPPPR